MKKTLTSRMISFLIVLSMVLSFIPTAFAAGTEPTVFSLESSATSVKPGDRFTVKVNIGPNSNLGSITYFLDYNQQALKVVKFSADQAVEFGSMMNGWMILSRDDATEGKVYISGMKVGSGLSEGGTIATITFQALDNAVLDTGDFVQELEDAGTTKNEPIPTKPAVGEKDTAHTHDVVIDPDVSAMVLKTAPTKTEYVQGQSFNVDGATMSLTYINGMTQEIPVSQEMCSFVDMSTPGDKTVTVSYKGQKATFKIKVIKREIIDAKFTAPTAVQNYKQKLENQTLDLTGAKWDVTYIDGSTEVVDVTDKMCSGYDFNQAGTQTVAVKYNQFQASFEIQVAERTISGISLKKAPAKNAYVAGKDSVLDVKDGVIQVNYSWGPSEEVDLTETMCSGYDLGRTGNQKVTVTYQGMKVVDAFEIIVTKEVKDFTVTAPTKLNYVEGQKMDLTDGQVILNYTDGSQETLNLTKDMLSGLNLDQDGCLKVGSYPVDVTVNEKIVKHAFTVEVIKKVITDAIFTVPTAEQTYKEGLKGQVLDLTGAKWQVTYNDGETTDVQVTQEMCTGYDFNIVGAQSVTVVLDGWSQTETFEINVEPKVPEKVVLESKPSKVEYTAGIDTALDLSSARLKVIYDNGTEEILPLTESMCSVVDLMKLGKQLVTVSYENLNTTFEINVKKAVMNLEWIKAPELSVYKQGQALEVTEGSFKVVYTDGSESSAIALTNSMCSDFDMNKAGQQSVKVTYTQPAETTIFEGKGTLSFTIGITGIEVTNLPLKLAYQLGEGFDGNGLTVNFVDGLTGDKTPIAWASGLLAVEGYNANLNAYQTLNVIYTAEDGTVYKFENAFEVKVGNPENVPGTGETQNQNGQGNTTQNGSFSNPLTGTRTSSMAVIIAMLMLCAVAVSTYKLKRK